MNPRLRTTLVTSAACALAVWVGANVAQEDYSLASFSLLCFLWVILSWASSPRVEAWLLGFLFFGYIIGNRGFAQLTPVSGLPLFIGELGLGFVLFLAALRGAFARRLPFQSDELNWLLLLWLTLGVGRIPWDVRNYGILALRDFAMVYYLLFFFCVQMLTQHAPSRAALRGAMTTTFLVLPVATLLTDAFDSFFLRSFVIRGVPLVLQKGDLLAMGMFAGFVWLVPLRPTAWREDWWRWLGALVNLGLGLAQLSRASLVGLLVALGFLALARRWRPLLVVVALGCIGVIGLSTVTVLQGRGFSETKAYAIYESVLSISDIAGARNYQSTLTANKGDNNRFRLIWWQNVIQETMTVNPLLGLGFGADLTRGFIREYYAGENLDFTARSPHNIFITTLGRMGLVGVAVLLTVYLTIARDTWRLSRRLRHRSGEDIEEVFRLHAIAWLMMVGACFGVVLEGPMGAVPFWIILGLAHAEAKEIVPATTPAKVSQGEPAPATPIATLHAETKGV